MQYPFYKVENTGATTPSRSYRNPPQLEFSWGDVESHICAITKFEPYKEFIEKNYHNEAYALKIEWLEKAYNQERRVFLRKLYYTFMIEKKN